MVLAQLIVYFTFDAVIFILLLVRMIRSFSITIPASHQARWVMPLILAVMAWFLWNRYSGMFWKIESICLLVFAVEFYFVRSGLSPKGFVSGGKLYLYEKIRTCKVDWERMCLIYERDRGMAETMNFDDKHMDQAIAELRGRHIKVKNI
jgi:hypothetical protein